MIERIKKMTPCTEEVYAVFNDKGKITANQVRFWVIEEHREYSDSRSSEDYDDIVPYIDESNWGNGNCGDGNFASVRTSNFLGLHWGSEDDINHNDWKQSIENNNKHLATLKELRKKTQ